jgi:hypothetical protein
MSLILENKEKPFLYLGGKSSASNDHFMIDSKITHVLNVAEEAENYFSKKYKYLKFDLEDTDECQIHKVFEESNEFLDNIYKSNGTVLVHCIGIHEIHFKIKRRSQSFKYSDHCLFNETSSNDIERIF